MPERISTTTKIKILLEGKLTQMKTNMVETWFKESFEWIEKTERYRLGEKLLQARNKWKKELNEIKTF